MPSGCVIPEIGYRDLRVAVGRFCNVFGFRECLRIGNHRLQLLVGQVSVMAYALSATETLANEAGEQVSLTREASSGLRFGLMVRVADVE